MIDTKSLMLGLIIGIAVFFSLGASHKKEKPIGMFQAVAIPNNDGKAIIINTASGEFKIANIGISPNFESGDRFRGPKPE